MRTQSAFAILLEMPETAPNRDAVGLCASCDHVRVITSDKGSKFYMCQRSSTDPTFPKYPRLPVIECVGYEARKPTPAK